MCDSFTKKDLVSGLGICFNFQLVSIQNTITVLRMCVLQKSDIKPAEELKLYSYDFNDLLLSDDETLECTISMFKEAGLLTKYKIPLDVS